MGVVKPSSVSSQTSDFDQACLPSSTPTSGINSPKGSPPETLFNLYGVSRESEWGKIISDCYKGISGETRLQARERAGPLNLNIQGPGGKWPLTHAERICELQSFLEDPTQTRYHNDILAAIDFHRGFNQNDLCSLRPTYFQNSRRVGANERNGLCWREGPISMKCNNITGSPVQNSTTSMSHVRTNNPHLPTTHHAAYAWDEEIEMYKVRIQFYVPTHMGGTGSVWESEMGFDTGSSALQVFPYEMTHLVNDVSFCRRVTVRYPTGSVEGTSFDIMMRVLSPAGKQCLPWLRETASCVGEGEVRLSGLTFQKNCLVTMEPANQVLQATTQRRWSALLAALGPAIL